MKENLIALICVILALYFSYHVLQGERGVFRLVSLNQQIETMSQEETQFYAERLELEKKVAMMRPGSVNKDLLEEQVRSTLGYRYGDEVVVLSN